MLHATRDYRKIKKDFSTFSFISSIIFLLHWEKTEEVPTLTVTTTSSDPKILFSWHKLVSIQLVRAVHTGLLATRYVIGSEVGTCS